MQYKLNCLPFNCQIRSKLFQIMVFEISIRYPFLAAPTICIVYTIRFEEYLIFIQSLNCLVWEVGLLFSSNSCFLLIMISFVINCL